VQRNLASRGSAQCLNARSRASWAGCAETEKASAAPSSRKGAKAGDAIAVTMLGRFFSWHLSL